MTSINFAKMLAEERKKAKLAKESGEIKSKCEYNIQIIGIYRSKIEGNNEAVMEKFRVGSIPKLYYIPNFATQQESDIILQHVYSHQNKWTKLRHRRLQNWGGIPSSRGMLPETLPPFLSEVCTHLTRCKMFEATPNHILLNEYSPGQGIMSHKDGPLYFSKVAILSLSGPAVIEFRKELRGPPVLSLYLHPLSLLIFEDEAYTSYPSMHAELERDEITSALENITLQEKPIPVPSTDTQDSPNAKSTEATNGNDVPMVLGSLLERKTRVSLTIRVVLNVLSENASPTTQVEQDELRRIEKHWYNAINEVV